MITAIYYGFILTLLVLAVLLVRIRRDQARREAQQRKHEAYQATSKAVDAAWAARAERKRAYERGEFEDRRSYYRGEPRATTRPFTAEEIAALQRASAEHF